MLGIKGGTQTWSNSAQTHDYKSDGAQNLGAGDRQKALGGEENVGDVLNKLSDPGYVDAAKKARTVGNPELGKDAFMTLLLTQMKNQDPTTPLKSHEMAAQLAQFTQLEKLNNINDGIAGMRKDAQPNQNFQALSFIGKVISTDNAKISRMDKDAHHDLRFDLTADANTMKLEIKDAEGKVVRTQELRNLKAGRNEANWNGMDDAGAALPPGDYTAAFEATGSNGHKLHVETKLQGTITGVNFTPMGPQLMVGKQMVSMSEVRTLTDPSLSADGKAPAAPAMPPNSAPMGMPGAMNQMPAMPNMKGGMPPELNGMPEAQNAMAAALGSVLPKDLSLTPPTQGPKKAEVKPENKPNSGKSAKLNKSNINEASMSQGLINKLNGAGIKAGMEG